MWRNCGRPRATCGLGGLLSSKASSSRHSCISKRTSPQRGKNSSGASRLGLGWALVRPVPQSGQASAQSTSPSLSVSSASGGAGGAGGGPAEGPARLRTHQTMESKIGFPNCIQKCGLLGNEQRRRFGQRRQDRVAFRDRRFGVRSEGGLQPEPDPVTGKRCERGHVIVHAGQPQSVRAHPNSL